MSEYPEHIDQIDDFYRSQLADHEIEPPEGLWGKISLGALETPASEVKATAIGFTNTQKYLGLLAGAVILVTGTLYFYHHKQETPSSTQDTIPAIEQQIDQQSGSSPETKGTTINTVTPSDQVQVKTHAPSSNTINDGSATDQALENQLPESKIEQPALVPATQEEQKADSVAEIKTTQKAPKEKVKFKDKLKKEYQDSTRKIFVPGK